MLFFTACPELIYFNRCRLVCVAYVRFKSWSWTLVLSLPVLYDLFQDISALFYHWKEVLHYLNLSHDLGFINTNAWKSSRTGELADSNCPHFSWTTIESDLFSRCFWRSAAISSADLGMFGKIYQFATGWLLHFRVSYLHIRWNDHFYS